MTHFNSYSNPTSSKGSFRSRSYWLETLSEDPVVSPLRGARRCDIAIIGGGFTGLSTAYHVRKLLPGADVRVIEASICGFGSSGRNAGFSSTLFGLAKTLTALRFGRRQAIAAHHYMEDAVEYLEHIIREHAINCDYEKRGSMLVATTPAQVKRVEQELRIAESWGLEGIEFWDKAELVEEFRTRIYHCGLYEKRTGLLNPARLVRGLMRIAEAAGAIIHEMTPVVSI